MIPSFFVGTVKARSFKRAIDKAFLKVDPIAGDYLFDYEAVVKKMRTKMKQVLAGLPGVYGEFK